MFRIWLYLGFSNFLSDLLIRKDLKEKKDFIKKILSRQSKKKYSFLFSQCRVGFLSILKFIKKKNKKKEIIFCSYNLPEMINIATNLKLKVKFCDLDYRTGTIDLRDLKKSISNQTLAIVLTNMFNNHKSSTEIKKIAKKSNITLIEDNAIYFDNFFKKKKKKCFSGEFGNFTIYSFNIMKNISSLYGGAVSTQDKNFIKYCMSENAKMKKFYSFVLFKQILIFFILKIMSLKILYRYLFIYIIRFVHKNEIQSILKLFYPSLKSINLDFPKFYYSQMSDLSSLLTYSQLKNLNRRKKLFESRRDKNKYYLKKLLKIKNKKFNLIKITDLNYQNFLDFPILVKDKNDLNDYLLDKGIEIRLKHYYNCQKMFKIGKKCVNAERYEKELVCLPNHPKISLSYIDFIVKNIEVYHSKL